MGWLRMIASRLRGRHYARSISGDAGFTLIELLSVVAIIGVLTAIVIPRFLGIRQLAIDARAKSDLRNAANCEEAYFVAIGEYLTCATDTCKSQLPNFRLSPGVTMRIAADNGPHPSFIGTASAAGGTKTFTYNSAAGGMR
jgi:prepilin-type N-terminal cleavage/methylation domain-containing protein